VNRECNSYNHLGAFYVTCFARVCEIFTAVVSELQRGPHAVLLFAATRHLTRGEKPPYNFLPPPWKNVLSIVENYWT